VQFCLSKTQANGKQGVKQADKHLRWSSNFFPAQPLLSFPRTAKTRENTRRPRTRWKPAFALAAAGHMQRHEHDMRNHLKPMTDTDNLPSGPLHPAPYITIPLAATITGLSEKAIRRKIEEGKWVEGREYRRSPDGGIFVSIKGFARWVEQGAV
jgi:hypothetical protein